MQYRLFLDDERFPAEKAENIVICRSSLEASLCVLTNGLPQHIFFDHDLGGNDTSMKFIVWLIEYLLDNDLFLPEGFTFSVHSMNPVGAENIQQTMQGVVNEFERK